MEGWIKIHREIRSHWIWNDPLYFRAWIWFLMRANHDDTKVLIGSTLVDVNRGQFITSIRKIAGDIGLTEQRVRTLLSLLIRDEMINTVTTSKLTQITICQYDDYQNVQQTNNTRSNKQATTEKNVKKKVNKEDSNIEVDSKEILKPEPRAVRIKKTIEQYKLWMDESKWNLYKAFVTWMLNENLDACFSLADQFSEQKFRDLMRRHNPKSELIKNKISAMENSKGLEKNNKSFSRTLNGWIARETNR